MHAYGVVSRVLDHGQEQIPYGDALTPETALRLERYFTGTTAQFWLNLQTGFDLRRAEISEAKALREIRPLKAS